MGENATELLPKTTVPDLPTREDEKCLICGAKLGDELQIGCSIDGCGYGAHEGCIAVMKRIDNVWFNADDGFKCADVKFQAKPEWIQKFMVGNDAECKKISVSVKLRGKVNTKSYTPKRVRYLNPDTECERCNKKVGINEMGHSMQFCSAWSDEVRCNHNTEYPFVKLRLLRTMTQNERVMGK